MSISQPNVAFHFFVQAASISKNNLPIRTRALHSMAEAQEKLGKFQEATKFFNDALILARASQDLPGEAKTRLGLAQVERRRGNPRLAQLEVERAINIFESLRPRDATPELRSSFFASRYGAYETLVDLLMGQGFDAQAFQVSERARARILLDALSESNKDYSTGSYLHSINSPALPLSDIQGQLDSDTVLLEYFLGEERSFLWIVSVHSFFSFELPPRSQIEGQVGQALKLLRNSDHLEAGGTAKLALQRLGRMLLGPVGDQIVGKRLAIVADGVLQYIPFAALATPGNPDMPLVAEHEVVMLPSAGTRNSAAGFLATKATA